MREELIRKALIILIKVVLKFLEEKTSNRELIEYSSQELEELNSVLYDLEANV